MATQQKQQTQTHSPTSGISIGSKHFINQLESVIIQIAKTLSVEHQIPVDPDAKEMTRNIVQQRLNTLLKDSTVEEVSKLNKEVNEIIKTAKDPKLKDLAVKFYHLLKLVSLDNV